MKKQASGDNRLYCRYPYQAPLRYAGIGPTGPYDANSFAPCSAVDVSEGGIGVHLTAACLQRGAVITVRMPVPDLKVTVPVLSEVRWVDEVTPGEYHAGLRFIS